jgi:hypothetical protein
VWCVISVYFNIRNTLPKSGTFLLGHPVYRLDGSEFESRQGKNISHFSKTFSSSVVLLGLIFIAYVGLSLEYRGRGVMLMLISPSFSIEVDN